MLDDDDTAFCAVCETMLVDDCPLSELLEDVDEDASLFFKKRFGLWLMLCAVALEASRMAKTSARVKMNESKKERVMNMMDDADTVVR